MDKEKKVKVPLYKKKNDSNMNNKHHKEDNIILNNDIYDDGNAELVNNDDIFKEDAIVLNQSDDVMYNSNNLKNKKVKNKGKSFFKFQLKKFNFWYGVFGGAVLSLIIIIYLFARYSIDLPDYDKLAEYKPSIITRFYAGDGTLLTEYAEENRVFVEYDQLPPNLINAFLSAEDKKFWKHSGIDVWGIMRAILSNITLEDFYEEIEEVLIMGDLGINATAAIMENLREKVKEQKIKDPAECKELLINSIKEQMDLGENAYEFEHRKSVVLVIGVNGVGKTTSVGKLADQLKNQGRSVLLAAADTFRAGAIEQLTEWANRAGVPIIAQKEGSDPAAVIYDAIASAKAKNTDVLLCDTAGRLHNKKNLMEELKKINRIIDKEYPEAFRETLIVLDGTTGQNALSQARQFMEAADITGIILTKMDGTAKGGIAVAIQSELGVPVKYIGVGEKIDDLQKFNSEEFVNALFDKREED